MLYVVRRQCFSLQLPILLSQGVIHEELSAGSEYETAPELEQHDILEELTSAAPMALARVPSRRSQRYGLGAAV